MTIGSRLAGLAMLIALLLTAGDPASAQTTAAGGRLVNGPIRVIDGDTIEIQDGGTRAGIGLIGVRAPRGNTACGRLAAARLAELTSRGIRLFDDPGLTRDERKRRMYYATTVDGQSIAVALIRAGLAHADGRGRERDALAAAERDAVSAERGCARQ